MTRPIVLSLREPGKEERAIAITHQEIRIGCGDDDDLRVEHPTVSPELRARIRRGAGELVLTNYSSAAPIFVNGVCTNYVALSDADVLKIGAIEIVVSVPAVELDPREHALVADIICDPTDETLRVVYSDWLEENGFPERAEYLRLEARIHQALQGEFPVTLREDVATLAGLGRTLPPSWLGLVRRRANSR